MREEQGEQNQQEPGAVREQIFSLFVTLLHQLETAHEEQHALIQKSASTVSAEVWSGMTVTMLHVLDVIGQREPVNGITIAKQLAVTKGGVTKIIRKLLEKQLLVKERRATNKKEVYFCLTDQGKEVFLIHQQLHKELEERGLQFLARYQRNELEIIVRFLQDLVAHSDLW